MAAHAITLRLPPALYARLEERAGATEQDLETELVRIVAEALPGREKTGRRADVESWDQYTKAVESLGESPKPWKTQELIDEIRR